MKRNILIITIMAAMMAVLTTACVKTIEFNGDIVNNQEVVMVSLPEADSTWHVKLTMSRFFLGNDRISTIENASFALEVNGQAMDNHITNQGNGYYDMGYVPRCGDTLTLTVNVPDKGKLTAGCRIPNRPSIGDISFDWDTTQYVYIYDDDTIIRSYGDVNVKFVIKDPSNEKNFYMLRVAERTHYEWDETEEYGNWQYSYITIDDNVLFDLDMTNEILDISESDNTGSMILFTDERINGHEHAITIPLHYSSESEYKRQYRLEFYSLSRDCYYYLKTRRAAASQDELTGIFSEPVQLYTNAQGGIGILGGMSAVKYYLKEISNN